MGKTQSEGIGSGLESHRPPPDRTQTTPNRHENAPQSAFLSA